MIFGEFKIRRPAKKPGDRNFFQEAFGLTMVKEELGSTASRCRIAFRELDGTITSIRSRYEDYPKSPLITFLTRGVTNTIETQCSYHVRWRRAGRGAYMAQNNDVLVTAIIASRTVFKSEELLKAARKSAMKQDGFLMSHRG